MRFVKSRISLLALLLVSPALAASERDKNECAEAPARGSRRRQPASSRTRVPARATASSPTTIAECAPRQADYEVASRGLQRRDQLDPSTLPVQPPRYRAAHAEEVRKRGRRLRRGDQARTQARFALSNRCWTQAITGRSSTARSPTATRRSCSTDATTIPGAAAALPTLKRGEWKPCDFHYDRALGLYAPRLVALCQRLGKLKQGDNAGGEKDIAAAKRITADIAEQFADYGIK